MTIDKEERMENLEKIWNAQRKFEELLEIVSSLKDDSPYYKNSDFDLYKIAEAGEKIVKHLAILEESIEL